MGKKHSKVVLFSGGYDSTVCVLKNLDADHFVFFDYKQIYKDNELEAVLDICKKLNIKLKVVSLPMITDVKNRNFIFALYATAILEADEIVIGSRNILPIFDKYKDSNWLSLKMLGYFAKIKVSLPITGWTKKRVFKFLQKYDLQPYNCYLNSKNYLECSCQNCIERRKFA